MLDLSQLINLLALLLGVTAAISIARLHPSEQTPIVRAYFKHYAALALVVACGAVCIHLWLHQGGIKPYLFFLLGLMLIVLAPLCLTGIELAKAASAACDKPEDSLVFPNWLKPAVLALPLCALLIIFGNSLIRTFALLVSIVAFVGIQSVINQTRLFPIFQYSKLFRFDCYLLIVASIVFFEFIGSLFSHGAGSALFIAVPTIFCIESLRVILFTEHVKQLNGFVSASPDNDNSTSTESENPAETTDEDTETLEINSEPSKAHKFSQKPKTDLSVLSPREFSVIEKLMSGLSANDIAKEFGIKEKSVKDAMRRALKKLELNTLDDLKN